MSKCLLCLQSCIGILATLILTLYLLKRQDAKLWRQLKSVLSVFQQVSVLCRIFNIRGARMMGMRGNRVDTQAGEIPLEAIHPGKVYSKGSYHTKRPVSQGSQCQTLSNELHIYIAANQGATFSDTAQQSTSSPDKD